jgi:hypothetical protein
MVQCRPASLKVRPLNATQYALLDKVKLAMTNGVPVIDAIWWTFHEDVNQLSELALAEFTTGLPKPTTLCRTKMAIIGGYLCDHKLYGTEEELHSFLPKPGKGNTTCKYHYVGLLRLIGHLNCELIKGLDLSELARRHPVAPTAHPVAPTAHPVAPTAHPVAPTAHPVAPIPSPLKFVEEAEETVPNLLVYCRVSGTQNLIRGNSLPPRHSHIHTPL